MSVTDRPGSMLPPPERPVIQRSRLADQAYEWIKDQILTRRLEPGQRLSVPAIAEELALSRSPVREAVQRLVQEGLGTERPHQGAVVAGADLPALVDLYEVRGALEGLAARLAVESGDPGLVASLEEIHERHRAGVATASQPDVIRADVAFHQRILEAGTNPELRRVLEPVLHRMSLAMLAGEPSWPARALAEHQAVLGAIQDGDADLARRLMEAHIARVRADLRSKLEVG